MNIQFEKKSELTAQLTLQLTPEDYSEEFDQELNKYKKKANIKGFRPGKVPGAVIKKMYGKPILVDIINNTVIKNMYAYLEEEKIKILGMPLGAEEQPQVEFDPLHLSDYTFVFDLGLSPEIELTGLTKDTQLDRYRVTVTEEKIEEELNDLRTKVGKIVPVEDGIQEDDSLQILAKELDGDQIKSKGLETSFQVLVSKIPNDKLKKTLLKGKKGMTFDFNVNDIESGSPEHIRKYILQLDDDDTRSVGENFKGEVLEVTRKTIAELNQEFFDQVFGEGEVTNEEEAKSILSKHLQSQTAGKEEALLFREIQDHLLENTDIDLPETFLKKWLETSRKEDQKTMTEKEFESFLMNLKWSLISNKIAEDQEIKVTEEELLDTFKQDIMQYLRGYPLDEQMLENYARRMMEDEKAVEKREDEILSDKIFKAAESMIVVKEVATTNEALEEILENARKEAAEARGQQPVEANEV